ncbi:hypothetical protein N9X42_01630 [Candidatus Pelagibacter bacterium]|nr:hypothetical protein [Candidatus Pelagibacter sp.]MDB2545287.1 hypothetical protein [Candidatus Pelagibacter bacterium]MDB3889475.1 hypothetical protein [Candidatus Pelagibacter sp.]MDB4594479.1 hypothetical protein [Candidatus Pelagibacter sp.]
MEEDISIINSNTRNERVRNFFINNKNKIISTIVVLIIVLVGAYSFDSYKTNKKKEISNKFNSTTLAYSENTKDLTVQKLVEIINEQDRTYSPLSLYFIIDNKLISNQSEINSYFDVLIEKTSLDKEIKNLVIYKKALFNADEAQENDLLNILNPLINSESVWKSHALYLMAEYFYSRDQKQKSKEFFNQIANLEDANSDIKLEAQKRLNRDLSD